MDPRKLIRIATRSIARTKMRSTLTMLGIIIGVGAVICMVAIGQGAQSRIEQSILDLGVNMVVSCSLWRDPWRQGSRCRSSRRWR